MIGDIKKPEYAKVIKELKEIRSSNEGVARRPLYPFT